MISFTKPIRMLALVAFGLFSTVVKAQQSYSLQQAIDYALANNETVKNAKLDIASAEAKVKETITLGLPQISGQALVAHSPQIQPFVLEFEPNNPFTAGLGAGGNLRPGDPVAFALALRNSAQATVTWNQLLFDGSYLVGLRATETFKQLSQKSYTATKIQTAEAVTKAYYGVLVNRERLGLFDVSLSRLDSSIKEIKALYRNGFAEKLDVDRLEVQRNSLLTEKQKTERLVALSMSLLKFQMGLDINEPISLSDKLEKTDIANLKGAQEVKADYGNRIEYSQLLTKRAADKLQLQNVQFGYIPKLYASATLGSLTAASNLANITEFDRRWFNYSQIGVSLQVPIFDSFMKRYQAQQRRIEIAKTDNTINQVKRSIDLQVSQSNINLSNALQTLDVQEKNMELAKEVLRVTKVKYQKGLGSNLEVTNAESDLRTAQINYFNALYDALIAKTDQEVATGKLLSN